VKDVRGAGRPFATNLVEKPYLDFNAAGEPHGIDFGYVSSGVSLSNDRTLCRALWFDRPIPHVRAIVKVVAANEGGGQFSCGMERAGRREGYGPGDKIFQDGDTYRFMFDGAFFANGEPRDWREGSAFPYRGARLTYGKRSESNRPVDDFIPIVAEFHFAEPDPQQGGGEMAARVFGHSNTEAAGCNGLERIYECLIFTNTLTKAERQALRGYLMKKWQDAEVNFTYGPVESRKAKTLAPVDDSSIPTLELDGELAIGVGADRAMSVTELTGDGTLVKTGAGDLFLGDVALPDASLRLTGGRVHVRSIRVTEDTLPGDPYLHMDASAETYELNDKGMVVRWDDVRGEGHPTAEPHQTGNGPTLEAVAEMGGRNVLDFPAKTSLWGTPFPTTYSLVYDATERLRTVVSVIGGQVGGVLAGYASEGKGGFLGADPTATVQSCYYDSSRYISRGIMRSYGGIDACAFAPWAKNLSTNWMDIAATESSQNWGLYDRGPGATHLRVDGVEAPPKAGVKPLDHTGFNVVSVSTYDNVRANSFDASSDGGYRYAGSQKLGETLVYTNTLNTESVKLVESYLSRKWFGRETKGYRPAVVGSLSLEGDATLEVFGGHPVTAGALSVAPTASVAGGVILAAGAPLTLTVLDDGTLAPLAVSGLDVSAGGALVLSGTARVKPGEYVLCDALSETAGDWTCAALPKGVSSAKVGVSGGKVVVSVTGFGMTVIVK